MHFCIESIALVDRGAVMATTNKWKIIEGYGYLTLFFFRNVSRKRKSTNAYRSNYT